MNDKELDLIKRAILIFCNGVRRNGDIYISWEDSCKLKEIYADLIGKEAEND